MQKTIRGAGNRFVAWTKRHRRLLLIIGAIVIVASIALQLLMPTSRALPFASVAGERVDFKAREEIVTVVQKHFSDATIKLAAGEKSHSDKLSAFGASINPDEMASEVLEYPLSIRFLPFSILWYHPQAEKFNLEFEDSRLTKVAKETRQKLTSPPRDASLSVEKGQLKVERASDGLIVSAEMIVDGVKHNSYYSGETKINIKGEQTMPSVSDEAIAAVKKQAEDLLARDIKITVDNDQKFTPSRDELASWITIKTNKKQAVSMALSTGKISSYIDSINKKVETKPTVTTVSLLDGKEQARKKGKTGLKILANKAAAKISDQLMESGGGAATIDLAREKVASPIKYNRTYSSSQAGLTAYVRQTTSGSDIKIAVRQLDGDGMFSYGRADDSIPSASTYKLYVMLRVFDDIKSGKRKWDDRIVGDNLSNCFERMIVVSANNCSEELIEQFGAQKFTDYLHDRGFSNGTGFNFSDATHSTAADLLKLLSGIEDGSLVRGQNRDMLLEKMSRQVYRNGIPAGSKGKVYDKVGFLWDYNHDAAIVHHPKGTYALVVMTKDHSFAKIAEITRQIERIMYP